MAPGENSTARRWMGVGHSDGPDGPVAAREAVGAALAGRRPSLVLLFAAATYDLDALLCAVQEALPPSSLLAGCTSAGEISSEGPTEEGVVAIALGGEGIEASVSIGRHASTDQRGSGAAAAASILSLSKANRVLLLLTPGLVPHQEEIVRGAYSLAGAAVPILGGAAGDSLRLSGTFQFAGGEVLQDAVVGIGIGSDGPIGLSMRHGWRKLGAPMTVTTSDGAHIELLDDRPALDVYLGRLEAPADAFRDAAALNRFALVHPLGLERVNGEDIRVPGEVDFERRMLICTAEVPPGALVWLMEGDDVSVIESASLACEDARARLDGAEPIGAIIFDCVGRRLVLGEGLPKEAAAVAGALGDVPFGGFYTYGEIARARGSSGVHNETFVVMALG
jgi:hypothetical protein